MLRQAVGQQIRNFHIYVFAYDIKPPEMFETSRLLLRLPTLDDTEPIFQKNAQDPEVSKYLFASPRKH
jgi:RimJ/RimL family protein N-acetyltransferase